MAKLLTLVAGPNPRSAVCRPDPADLHSLTAIWKALIATAEAGDDHVVLRAYSLANICDLVARHPLDDDGELQIVGHGKPGMLALGMMWDQIYGTAADTFVLDENPTRHRVLKGIAKPTWTVSLIGCQVGDDHGTDLADGPTLVFNLARMWKCTVRATVAMVGPSCIGPDGRYRWPERMIVAKDRSVSARPDLPAPERALAAP